MKFVANGSYCMAVVPCFQLTNNYSNYPPCTLDNPSININLSKIDLTIEFSVSYVANKMFACGAWGNSPARWVDGPTVNIEVEHMFHKHNAPFYLNRWITWKTNPKLYLYLVSKRYRNFVKKHELWFI